MHVPQWTSRVGRNRRLGAMMGKVLIVDDEVSVLKSTALMVEALGHKAITVADVSKVLSTINEQRPDVVLQDLRMPGLNVGGLVALLRLDAATARLPIIVFSADPDAAAAAAQYDAWGVLPKPFSLEQLSALLAPILGTAPSPAAADGSLARRTDAIFHDYWNLLAALASYSIILDRCAGRAELDQEGESAVHGLEELVLALESKTDHLRRHVAQIMQDAAPNAQAKAHADRPRTE